MSTLKLIEAEIHRQVALIARLQEMPPKPDLRDYTAKMIAYEERRDELGKHISIVGAGQIFKNPAIIRAMLRVEIDRYVEDELWDDPKNPMRITHAPNADNDAPMKIIGVSVYTIGTVNELPAPGWRVINPLDAR